MLHKFNMKQVYDLYASSEFARTLAALDRIHNTCKLPNGHDDQNNYVSSSKYTCFVRLVFVHYFGFVWFCYV